MRRDSAQLQEKTKNERKQTMNICALAGHLARQAVVHGTERKVVRFTLETRSNREEGEKDYINYVPCALFNPTPEAERLLVAGDKGVHVELEGRINSSSYEGKDGKKYQTEVVVFNRSLKFLKD